MASFLTVTEEAHINSIRTAAPQYMSGFSDLTKRNHLLLNMMASWGQIEYNASDISRIWQIRVRQPEVRVFSNTTNKTFSDHNPYEQMQVGIRGFEASDLLKELEWKLNQGSTQLIPLYENKMEFLGSTLVERMQEWIPRDGDTAAYQDGYQGFESCLLAENATTGSADPDATDRIVLPNDSYGGHPTDLANFGGTWTSDLPAASRMNKTQNIDNDWPYGQGDSEYDALSPMLWAYDSSGWGATAWEDNVEPVIRDAATALRNKNGMGMGDIDLCFLLAPNLYPGAENYYSSRFRIIQPFTGGDQGHPMPNSIYVDGVALKSDYSVPADIGYGVCPNHIEMFNLKCMNMGPSPAPEQMIDVFGPDWSPEHGAYLMRVSTFGNLRMQPKFMCKLAPTAHYIAQTGA